MEDSLSQQILDRLWELQTEVSRLADKERELNSKPEGFAEVDREYQTAKSEMDRLTQRLDDLGKERRELERSLGDEQEVLKKYQGQLMQVKNQQQYAAAWKEIDNARRKVKEIEDGVIKKMGEMDEIQKQLDERQGSHSELHSRHDAEYQKWQSGLGDLRAEIEKIRERIARIESTVPEREKNHFNMILRQRQGVAMAKMANDACGFCRYKVRTQVLQQLRRGETITCEGCRRIIYMEQPAANES